jgi:hypothetical protein
MNAQEVRDKKIQFGMWLGLPEQVRVPKEQQDFAKEIGVTPQCLSRWKADPLVKNSQQNAIRIFAQRNHKWEIYQAMVDKAKSGNVQAMKLFWEYCGDLQKTAVDEAKMPQEMKVIIMEGKDPRRHKPDEAEQEEAIEG